MTAFADFPAFEVQYDLNGALVDANAETALLDAARQGDVTDVIVISHGWNNDMPEARALYTNFFTLLQQAKSTYPALTAGRKFAVMWLFWPSKRFDEPQNIAGGAAAVADVSAAQSAVNTQLDRLSDAFSGDAAAQAKIAEARQYVPNLETDPAARDAYVTALSAAIPAAVHEPDDGLDAARTEASNKKGVTLQELATPVIVRRTPAPGSGGAASIDTTGAAAGILSSAYNSVTGGALALANCFTYWAMKERAGTVGKTGALQTVQKLLDAKKSVHLVGHSFGARLVSSAVNALPAPQTVSTMTLLQGAFSHYGFSPNYQSGKVGFFRSDVAGHKVRGEIQDTHSVHDWAVGIMYPLASRILNQVGAAIGDASDVYGGLGRNGAQLTPEAADHTLLDAGQPYPALNGSAIRNLNGDAKITGHGDICKPDIAYTLLRAIASSS